MPLEPHPAQARRDRAYDEALARYRAAWRNLFAGTMILVVLTAAVVWLAALT